MKDQADIGITVETDAAQSTMALGPLVGLAREDFVGAIAMLLSSSTR